VDFRRTYTLLGPTVSGERITKREVKTCADITTYFALVDQMQTATWTCHISARQCKISKWIRL